VISWRCAAVLFDLDGVLVDSRRCIETIWRVWAAGKRLDPEPFIRIAQGRRTSETIRTVAPDLDVAAEVAALDRLEEIETAGIHPVPGADRLVRSIPAARWAIVTSGSRRVASLRLGVVGLPVPDVFITSDTVRQGKPAPDGYLAAAARLGLEPADCVAVEDSPPGIAAARAAGMRVIALLTTHQDRDLTQADIRLPALTHLGISFGTGERAGVALELSPP
jgi:mannitol-1-/sugar-/sorbitol-6-phosphatase